MSVEGKNKIKEKDKMKGQKGNAGDDSYKSGTYRKEKIKFRNVRKEIKSTKRQPEEKCEGT
jgi:hypothetical protein